MIWLFFLNIFLAVIYVVLTGHVDAWNFVLGFALGFVIIGLYNRAMGGPSYPGKFLGLVSFAAFFVRILVRANMQVAWEVLTPKHTMMPRIVRYPVQELTDVQITALGNAISLTPGTLTCDVDNERRVLYIHAMYAGDRAAVIRDLDELRDRLVRDVFT
ncbi:MAG: Na+/H+ antiporter subunit E [Phycisphaeraceae bacterium]